MQHRKFLVSIFIASIDALIYQTLIANLSVANSEKICSETNITFSSQTAEFTWKINNIRNFFKLYCSNKPTSKLLKRNIILPNLPTGNHSWEFEGTCNPKSFLLARCEFYPDSSWKADTVFMASMTIRDSISTVELNEKKLSGYCYDMNGAESCLMTLDLSSPVDSYEEEKIKHITELIFGSDRIELTYRITAFIPNEAVSDEVDCTTLKRTPKPNNLNMSPPFLKNIKQFLDEVKYTDLTVRASEEEFRVHRVILASSSPILAEMINNHSFVKNESLLDLGTEIPSVLGEILEYIYTGKIEGMEEISDILIQAAHKLGFPILKSLCETALINEITADNAFNYYFLGMEVEAQELKAAAFNFMKLNKNEIVNQTEFRKLSVHHPEVMYQLFLSH